MRQKNKAFNYFTVKKDEMFPDKSTQMKTEDEIN